MDRRQFCQLAGTALSASAMAHAERLPFLGAAAGDAEQQRDLEFLLKTLIPTRKPSGRINAIDVTWEDWQKRTGELPPKFSLLPSSPKLPDVLRGIKTKQDWEKRRKEIRAKMQHWMTGTMPPAPDNLRAVITNETHEGNLTIRDVRLEFGPDHKGTLRLQMMIPAGDKPRPVFLTNQPRTTPWVATATARGYISVIFFARDAFRGSPDDSDAYIELYPDYDFSCLARRAWAASRAVDYLLTLPEVDHKCIALSGHSRNGKTALMAAAFDERITAVIPSSGNTGECNPWRYTTDPYQTETIEQITCNFPHWFHPRLRFFAGREDKLPFDQNEVIALVAPRAILMAASYNEEQGSDFGFEENYRAVRKVYEFLSAPNRLGLNLRPGPHATMAGDIETRIDFLDQVFGRTSAPVMSPTFVFDYTFERWKKQSGETAASKPSGDKLAWALGTEPAQVPFPDGGHFGRGGDGWIDALDERPIKSDLMKSSRVSFGADIKGDFYQPLQSNGKLPVVIWLHPFTYNTGYSRDAKRPFEELTKHGYAVLAFDQIGCGNRVLDAKEFYSRYPKWSFMGKMVADTRAAITAAASNEQLDASRIYLMGYALGAEVALWTSALDHRPAAVVSVAGVTPLRTSKIEGAVWRYSHLHGLLPRLGFYADHPASVPVDYDEVFRRIGDRKTLLIAPTHDQYADLDALQALAKPFPHIEIQTPADFNRFKRKTWEMGFDWLDKQRA